MGMRLRSNAKRRELTAVRGLSNGLRGRLRYYGRRRCARASSSYIFIWEERKKKGSADDRIRDWRQFTIRRCTPRDRRATPRARTDDGIGFRWDAGENTNEADWDRVFSSFRDPAAAPYIYMSRRERGRRKKRSLWQYSALLLLLVQFFCSLAHSFLISFSNTSKCCGPFELDQIYLLAQSLAYCERVCAGP